MSIGKRKKKSSPTLLLEPTVEEEQRILQREQLQEQEEEFKKQQQLPSGYPEAMNHHLNDKLKRQIRAKDSRGSYDYMMAPIDATGGGRAIKNVIMTTESEENRPHQTPLPRRGREHRNDNKNNKQLTNLLAILFGLLLIVCATTTQSVTAREPETLTTLRMTTSTNGSGLFNSTASATTGLDTGTTAATTSGGPTTKAPAEMTTTTTRSSEADVTVNTTGEPSEDSTETTGTTITVSEKTDVPPAPTTNGSLERNETAPTSDEAEADGGNDDDDDEQPVGGGGGSSNKLNSGFIIETAGEAADQILSNLRPTEVVSSDADLEMSEPSTGASESASLERRDIEGDLLNDSSRTPKPTTPIPAPATTIHPELKLALDSYTKWKSVGDDLIELFSRKMLPVVMEHGYDIDAVTVTGLLQVFNGIRGLKGWALKLLDASAKITPGLLVGTQSDFGDFDECLSVRVDDPAGLVIREAPVELDELTGLPTTTLVGRYCLADIEFPKPPREKLPERNEELQTDYAPIELRRPLFNFSQTAAFKESIFVETGNFFHMLYVDPLRVGVCLTNKIDPDSFARVVNKLLEEFRVRIDFKGRCVTKYDPKPWTTQQRVSAWVIMVACSLVTLCTLLDVLHTKLNKLPLPDAFSKGKLRLQSSLQRYRPIFTSFSLIRNTKRLFKPQQQQQLVAPTSNNSAPPSPGSHLNHRRLHSSGIISAGATNFSTSSTSGLSYSSSESSPSIERRSSAGGSDVYLIGGEFSSNINSSNSKMGAPYNLGLAHFASTPATASTATRSSVDSGTGGSGEINLLCLHGIRVITMIWMIVNHTYMFGGFFVLWAYRRLIDIAEWPKSLSFQLVLNGWLTVETYFFLGATILVLSVLPTMKAQKFTYVTYVLHRLIRLLPAYTGLICLNFLWPLISSGPVWLVKGKSFIQSPCENYLWANYLFINNWIWPEKQCMVHSWYLSADFQLYLMAPVIVYLLYRWPVFGHSLNIIVALVASIVSGLVIYANKLMPTTLINKLEFDTIKQQLSYSYFATYQHVGPYCLGIFTGYLLYKRPHVHLPKHLTWALWILLPPLSLTTLLLTYLWNGAYGEPALINPSPIVSAFYVAIHRTIWTSLIAWLVFACATGRAKLLSNFLSHSMFIPLSRLSFSIYLVHLPVIMYRALNLRHTIEWTDSNILWEACGNFIVSLIVAYFVNVTFESPFINLEQVIFGRNRRNAGTISGHRDTKVDCSSDSQTNQKLRPQSETEVAANFSKTTSENDSDDSKSAKSSDDLATVLESSSSSLGAHKVDELVMGNHLQTGTIKRRALRRQQQEVGSIYGGQTVEPASMSHYGDVEDHNDDDDDDISGGDILTRSPDLTDSPPVMSNGGQRQSASIRRNRTQQVAPASEQKQRRLSASKLDHTASSSIYQMAPIEYQRYAQRQVPSVAMLQKQANGAGNLTRFSQYATMAPSSGSRFNRGLNGRASGGLDEYQRSASHRAPTGSISRNSTGGQLNAASNPPRLRSSILGGTPGGLRRQGRYNTLTVTGSREWRQQIIENAAEQPVDSDSYNWLRASEDRSSNNSLGGSSNWLVGHSGAGLLPRIDSSTLRGGGQQLGRPLYQDSTRASSIVEEEDHEEEIIRI